MGVFRCGRNEFYDVPTKSCTDCSVICDNMDIQDTREQCMKYCSDSDYFTTTSTIQTTTITNTVIPSGSVTAICVLLGLLVLLAVATILFLFRERIMKIIKTHCTGEEQKQIHAQETSLDSQESGTDNSAAHSLLPSGREAFADLPQRDYDLSTLQQR